MIDYGTREDYIQDVFTAFLEYKNNPSSKNFSDWWMAKDALYRHFKIRL